MQQRVPSMLDELFATARERNWPLESLRVFRMEEGGGEGGAVEGSGGAEGGSKEGEGSGTGAGGARSLESLLAALPETDRNVLLGEVGKARSEAKNLRERMKALEPKAAEYDKLAEASKTETERAQEAARKAQESVQAMREQLVAAEVKAALAGIVPDPAAVAEDLNLSKFLNAEGAIDTEAISALKERYSALAPAGNGARAPKPNEGQGANGNAARTAQITREQLAQMSPEQITEAQNKGLLNDLLGVKQ